MDKLSMNDPLFATYAIAATIMILKGVGMAWLPHSLVAQPIRQGLLKPLGGRADQIHFEVRIYRHRGRQSALVEAVWDATDR